MHFFEWSIGFSTPYHFLEMFIAQGIIFGDDSQQDIYDQNLHQKLDDKCFEILKNVVATRSSIKNDGYKPSEVAALCIMKAR